MGNRGEELGDRIKAKVAEFDAEIRQMLYADALWGSGLSGMGNQVR